jgi:hypothetical protein
MEFLLPTLFFIGLVIILGCLVIIAKDDHENKKIIKNLLAGSSLSAGPSFRASAGASAAGASARAGVSGGSSGPCVVQSPPHLKGYQLSFNPQSGYKYIPYYNSDFYEVPCPSVKTVAGASGIDAATAEIISTSGLGGAVAAGADSSAVQQLASGDGINTNVNVSNSGNVTNSGNLNDVGNVTQNLIFNPYAKGSSSAAPVYPDGTSAGLQFGSSYPVGGSLMDGSMMGASM